MARLIRIRQNPIKCLKDENKFELEKFSHQYAHIPSLSFQNERIAINHKQKILFML